MWLWQGKYSCGGPNVLMTGKNPENNTAVERADHCVLSIVCTTAYSVEQKHGLFTKKMKKVMPSECMYAERTIFHCTEWK